jgi:hypothetical protein
MRDPLPGKIPPFPKDGIYRAILLVMVLTILFGAAVTLAGHYYFHDPAVSRFGFGVVMVGGVIYFFFRILGRREARRQATRGNNDLAPGDNGPE